MVPRAQAHRAGGARARRCVARDADLSRCARRARARGAKRYAARLADLKEIQAKGGAPAAAAQTLLAWLTPDPTITTQKTAALRRWWDSLTPKLREALAAEAEIPEDPDDAQLTTLAARSALTLEQCNLTDLAFLAPLTELGILSLKGNPLTSFASLPRLPRRHSLYVDECTSLTALDGIENAPLLKDLNATWCGLKSLTGVEAPRGLKKLLVEQNAISSLAPVSGLTRLQELVVDDNAITDLSPLEGCRALRNLECRDNPVRAGLDVLQRLPLLTRVRGVKVDLAARASTRDTNDADRA